MLDQLAIYAWGSVVGFAVGVVAAVAGHLPQALAAMRDWKLLAGVLVVAPYYHAFESLWARTPAKRPARREAGLA